MADFTSIAKSKLGPMRFPKDDTPVNNEVTTYTMSQEEIDRLYPKSGKEIRKVELTKEKYLQHKNEGMKNAEIARQYGVTDANIYYYLKKWDLPKESEVRAEKIRDQMTTPLNAQEYVEIYTPPKEETKEMIKVSAIECVGPITYQEDKINSPSHYTAGGIETIDYMQAKMTKEQFEGYLLGNIFKYTSRFQFKNGLEDLKKSRWYISKLIEVMESEPSHSHK